VNRLGEEQVKEWMELANDVLAKRGAQLKGLFPETHPDWNTSKKIPKVLPCLQTPSNWILLIICLIARIVVLK
jgi:hypothetical protein